MANVQFAPSGEIDLATFDAFRDRLYEIIDECDMPIVRANLAAVTFIDSAGYHALVDANAYAIRCGHIMTIRNLRAPYSTLIRFCDEKNELHIEVG